MATIPAIVSQELFDRVQGKLAANQQMARRNNTTHEYLLRSLVSCGRCGLACHGRTAFGRYAYYVCRGSGNAVGACRQERCQARAIRADVLDQLVWTELGAALRDPASIRQALVRAGSGQWLPQELRARREHLRRGRVNLTGQVTRFQLVLGTWVGLLAGGSRGESWGEYLLCPGFRRGGRTAGPPSG